MASQTVFWKVVPVTSIGTEKMRRLPAKYSLIWVMTGPCISAFSSKVTALACLFCSPAGVQSLASGQKII